MRAPDTSIVILAAGKGTRMRSGLAKVLHRAGGRPLIEHVVRSCQALKPAQVLVIVGHQAEAVGAVIESLGVQTLLQQPQKGTGHAMQMARRAIRKGAKLAVVVPGDAPLLRAETLASLIDMHRRSAAAATVLTAEIQNPFGYGRIVRDSAGRVQAIVEEKSATPEQREIHEVNSSIYCFTLAKLWPCLSGLRPDNTHHELYLTDAIGLLRQQNETVLAQIALDANEILGCNTRAHLADVDRIFRARKALEVMEAGATIYLPETVLIDPEVTVDQDSLIEPCVQLLGKTRIGSRCQIGAGCVLTNVRVGDGAIIAPQSHLLDCRVGPDTRIGPFSRLRPGTEVHKGAHVGSFVEVKNTVLHEGAKAPHLTYLGDATVGAQTNVGAGTITCNYDGVHKHETKIGKNVFIGSDTALVAPVRVGDGAYVAAGSIITENVPADALAIARGRQVNKPGWARDRRLARQRAAKSSARSKPAKRPARPRPARPRPARKSRPSARRKSFRRR